MSDYDAIVIGGGPAGSALATWLARAGTRVLVVERDRFPRYHIGESLLPGSNPMLRDLGVFERLQAQFVRKPGGTWYYRELPLSGPFAEAQSDASFAEDPDAFMVDRARFDEILLRNAERHGAEVWEGCRVCDVLREGERVVGVTVRRDEESERRELRAPALFDCSGLGAIVARHLGIRRRTDLAKMAIFTQLRCEVAEEQLAKGWFVGEFIDAGWIWAIPLARDRVSVGVVVSQARYRAAGGSPTEFLDRTVAGSALLRRSLGSTRTRIEPVRSIGNVGYSSTTLVGEGYCLVGDAAFFIDPLWSSGVHLALTSAQQAARAYLERRTIAAHDPAFVAYDRRMRAHESIVTRMVRLMYLATESRLLYWLIPRMQTRFSIRRFSTFVGGDFGRNAWLIHAMFWFAWWVSAPGRLLRWVAQARGRVRTKRAPGSALSTTRSPSS